MKIDREHRRVFVSYVFWESDFDEWIENMAERLAPMHFHTYREGGILRLGQRIEVLDERGDWLESFVVDEKEEEVNFLFLCYCQILKQNDLELFSGVNPLQRICKEI